MQNELAAVLILVLGILVLRAITRERRDYARFSRLRRTAARQRVYRRWLVESFVLLGGLAVVVLLAAGDRVDAVLRESRALPGFRQLTDLVTGPLGAAAAIGGAALVAALLVATVIAGRSAEEIPSIGDIGALIPRNRAELGYGAALSINAGVVEELLFRLALPALVFGVTGSALAAMLGSALVFGLLHLYQGPAGVIGTSIMGLVLTALYVSTGSILVPIVLHALLDLRALVLLPVLVTKAHRIRS